MHPFAAVVAMMEGPEKTMWFGPDTEEKESLAMEKGKGRSVGERPAEGRMQTPRRGFIGPGGIVGEYSNHSRSECVRRELNTI
jgi:hypothetical protein